MSQPVATEDLSFTLFSERFGEHYHSTFGARSESMHVFLEAGLRFWKNAQPANLPEEKRTVFILEIGFGTGLNAWLTAMEAERTETHMVYEAIELFPIEMEEANALYAAPLYLSLHQAPWEQEAIVSPFFTLHKRKADVSVCPFNGCYNVVFFDAFSPNVQPELWQEELFAQIFAAMASGGVLTTYCAKGEVRRRMQRAGFITERIPGPKGKREMLRATKP